MRRGITVFLVLSVLLTLGFGTALAQKQWEGATIRLCTEDVLAASAEMFRSEWEEKTGAKVTIITVPYGELYEKLLMPLVTGVEAFDLMFYPGTWLGTFAGNEYVLPLDEWIQKDEAFNWGEIPDKIQVFSMWAGKIFAIPGDGDTHLLYYRKDVIENPENKEKFKKEYGYELGAPKTWKEYRDVAEFFHGWDWDGDGKVEYGAAEARRKAGQAVWTFLTRAAPYTSIPEQKGGLFFDPRDMTPLINSPGHVEALKDYIELMKVCSPGIEDYMVGDLREDFYLGKVALTIDWGDTAQFAANAPGTVVSDKVGYALLPGARKTWDYENEKWVDFPNINFAPFLAFGGWVYGIPINSKHPEAAYDFIAFLAGPEKSYIASTTARTGVQPFRDSHFTQLDRWKAWGFADPGEYLDVYRESFQFPNSIMDLRIPGMARYQEALDTELAEAVTGRKTPQQALDDAVAAWKKITDELGREKQLELYKASLGF